MAIEVRNTKKGRSYTTRVRDIHGEWYPCRTFKKKVDAENYERELLTKRDRGESSIKFSASDITFLQYTQEWKQECRSHVGEGWKKDQERQLEEYVLPYLGSYKLTKISVRNIADVLNRMDKLGLSEQTTLHVYNILHKMFEDAIDHFEFPIKNPVIKKYKPKVLFKERQFLTAAEINILLVASRNHWMGPAIWLGLNSGLRPCEIQALTVGNVNFETKRINIQSSYCRKEGKLQPRTKQGSWGGTPMSPSLIAYLKPIVTNKSTESFVANGPNGGMLNYQTFSMNLKKICESCGIKVITPHELRHSCTVLWMAIGAGIEDCSLVLNHSSVKSTARYIHRTPERLALLADKIQAPT